MHSKLLRVSLVLLLAVSAAAQTGLAGADWPSAERLREHVTYLASDKLDGRRTGTAGARLAAEYIVREFARYKLKPGGTEAGEDRRYVQQFPFVAGVETGKNNSMSFAPRTPPLAVAPAQSPTGAKNSWALDLRLGEDWTPLGFSSNKVLRDASATFVGYGITAKDLNYDDYAGANIKGRAAIAFAGTPDGDDPHGKFARYAGVRWKAIAAREAGAVALIVIAREENFKDEPLARLRYDNSAGDAGLPVVVISRQATARMLSQGGLAAPLAELEKIARAVTLTAAPGAIVSGNPAIQNNLASLLPNLSLTISTDIVRRNAPASNVIGILEGTDAGLKGEAIVIGAHYDHLGRGGEGSLAPKEGEVHHGADDNASGVAGLLELARLFSRERPRRTIIFIAFSGEEEGLLGSNYYVNHPSVPLAQTVAMINMDMIGRMKENRLIVGGVGTAQQWRSIIEAANLPTGAKVAVNTGGQASESSSSVNSAPIVVGANGKTVVSLKTTQPFALSLSEDGYGPSDHSSFYSKQVPVLFFWTGTHADYHKPSDTADKIDYEAEARVVSFIAGIVRSVDSTDARPTFAVAKSEGAGRATGFRVYLGTIPNYADSNDGLKLDGVREGSPAEKAGLKANDVIRKLAGRDVKNVYDYTYILGEMKAGEEYEVEVLREGKSLKLKITPAARKQ
jgi:aminopeptidase YwaD